MLVECVNCEAVVDSVVVGEYEHSDWLAGDYKYSFTKCARCNLPFLLAQEKNSQYWGEPFRLYPTRENLINPAIPSHIGEAFSEALSCLKAKAFTATAIMCRKALQGICDQHGYKERNLQVSLERMKNDRIIDSHLYDWADALRVSGNEAAHDVAITIDNQDARDIVEFTRALLEYVYTYRERFREFSARREGVQTPDEIPF